MFFLGCGTDRTVIEMHAILEQMILMSPGLHRAERKIADALTENPEAIEHMTLAELSRGAGASEATIIRFCRRLGYDGFTSFKEAFTKANHEDPASLVSIGEKDDMASILNKLYRNNLEVLSETMAIKTNDYEQVLEALLHAKSIHFFAVGDACAVAKLCCMKFKRIGVTCSAEEDVMCQMITASNLTPDDAAIAVSYEGRSRNVVEAMKIAKERGATTISITRRDRSPLVEYTDLCLLISAHDLTIGRDQVTRRVSDQLILEALYLGYESRIRNTYRAKIRVTQQAIDRNKI